MFYRFSDVEFCLPWSRGRQRSECARRGDLWIWFAAGRTAAGGFGWGTGLEDDAFVSEKTYGKSCLYQAFPLNQADELGMEVVNGHPEVHGSLNFLSWPRSSHAGSFKGLKLSPKERRDSHPPQRTRKWNIHCVVSDVFNVFGLGEQDMIRWCTVILCIAGCNIYIYIYTYICI